MARRPEGDPLGRDRDVGPAIVVGGDEPIDVDQERRLRRQARVLAHGHRGYLQGLGREPAG